MTEVNEELGAYNSYKRHMRVFGKSKEILPFEEWKRNLKSSSMDRLTKAMGKYLSDTTKITEKQMVNLKLATKAQDAAEHHKKLVILKARRGW